ncbi:MAG TPA: class I SAM-dependent methyltransferase [Gemmatimonadota bacterium]|nr:class I SAM-dependent methyltransferase [Gemmatimonadota bacterium]
MTEYDDVADAFIAARTPIGVATVLAWARDLPAGGRVLDLGCGHGIPIARALADGGLVVHGVDTSPRLLEAFRENVPGATAECADAATVEVEDGSFDGVVAWGLLFLLEPAAQEAVIRRSAAALKPGGRLLMTAPWQTGEWADALTGRRSVSLGRKRYHALLAGAGLVLTGEADDEGDNHYWLATKPADLLLRRGPSGDAVAGGE